MTATLGLGAVLLAPVLFAHAAALAAQRTLIMVTWLDLVTTAIAYVLFARGLRHLPAGTVGTLSLAEPLTAVGLLVLGERPGPIAVLGGLSLLAGSPSPPASRSSRTPGSALSVSTTRAGSRCPACRSHSRHGQPRVE